MSQQLHHAKRSMVWPAAFTALGIAVLVGLGTWQMQRLAWKQEIIAKTQSRIKMAVIATPQRSSWQSLNPAALEYRRVKVTGRFLHNHEMPVFTNLSKPKGKFGGPGYWIITPLVTVNGIILVNRGFVPQHLKAAKSRKSGQTESMIEITGLLRASERTGIFTPENKPQTNEWYYRDANAMARHINRKKMSPFFIDLIAPKSEGNLPQSGETRLEFPNKHFEYALTWYALALSLAGVFGAFFYQTRYAD